MDGDISRELNRIADAIKDLRDNFKTHREIEATKEAKKIWISKLLELSILTMTALSFLLINLKSQEAIYFMLGSVFILVLTLCCGVLFFFIDKTIHLALGMDAKFPSTNWFYFNVEFIIYLGYILSVVLAFISIYFNILVR